MRAGTERSSRSSSAIAMGVAIVAMGGCATTPGGMVDAGPEAVHAPLEALPVTPEEFVDTVTGAYVLVDLDVNRLSFIYHDDVLWEAPIGTGTGLRLESDDGDWDFSTPQGVFQVKLKEEMPIWYLPDWYFVEKDLPVPPPNAPERRLPNQLGVAAVYLGEEIAIHGTERPELLGRRVSHGCIRLENRFAQRLFHNVQVGTPVVVVGGEDLGDPGPTTDPGAPRPRPADPLAGVASQVILDLLTQTLEDGDTTGAWVPLASRLITRAHLAEPDSTAMRGLLRLAGAAATEKLAREYATFLADAYARGSWIALVSLARIEEDARERATADIVEATMALYGGSLRDENAPWPSRRVHSSALGPVGRSGWDALAAAEHDYRQRRSRTAEVSPR